MTDHWSTEGGCHEDCPACAAKESLTKTLRAALRHIEGGNPVEADALLKLALKGDTKNWEDELHAMVFQAHEHISVGNPHEAERLVREALEELGEDPDETVIEKVGEAASESSIVNSIVRDNALQALLSAAKNLRDNWEKNLTMPIQDLNAAIELAEELPPITDLNAAFVRQFLATFAPYVDRDEAIPGSFAVDRVVEFVKALQTKEVA